MKHFENISSPETGSMFAGFADRYEWLCERARKKFGVRDVAPQASAQVAAARKAQSAKIKVAPKFDALFDPAIRVEQIVAKLPYDGEIRIQRTVDRDDAKRKFCFRCDVADATKPRGFRTVMFSTFTRDRDAAEKVRRGVFQALGGRARLMAQYSSI